MKTARWLFSFRTRPGTRSRSRASACQWCRQHLGAFYRWDDSLSDAELSEIERHVNACSECGKIWDEFRVNQDRIVEASLPSFDKERVLGKVLREIDSCPESGTRERQGYFLPNGWSLRFAGVCLVLLALPVLAKFGLELTKSNEVSPKAVIQSGLDSSSPSDSTANTQGDKAALPQQETDCSHTVIASDPSELELLNLPGEDVERTLLLATLPQNEEQLEEWARKEFPHVMWLYDELRELDDTLSWQDLLVRSGEIYRFDWPIGPDEPNVLPRLSAVIRVAEAAGWRAELVYGEKEGLSSALHNFPIQHMEWVDRDESRRWSARAFVQLSQSHPGPVVRDRLHAEEVLNCLVAMQESLDQLAENRIDLDSYADLKDVQRWSIPKQRSFVFSSCRIIEKNIDDSELAADYSVLLETPSPPRHCRWTTSIGFWRRLSDLWTKHVNLAEAAYNDAQTAGQDNRLSRCTGD